MKHWSDCAVNNEPAYPAGDCDCGGYITRACELEFIRSLSIKGDGLFDCPNCGGTIKSSGFTGHYFCWGKCYCYVSSEKYNKIRRKIWEENLG